MIHLSHSDNGPGIKLKDLANNTHHPESAVSGFWLLWTRFTNRGTDRRARRAVESVFLSLSTDRIHVLMDPCDCSPRPWSFIIIFYVFLIFVAGALPFILGRVINISTRLEHQLKTYTEGTIYGDLSQSDIAAAASQLDAFTVSLSFWYRSWGAPSHGAQDYVRTWTLAAFTDRSSLPTVVRMKYNDDDVYFAELIQSQLKPNGKGLGTFVQNGSVTDSDEPVVLSTGTVSEGSMLKYVDRV